MKFHRVGRRVERFGPRPLAECIAAILATSGMLATAAHADSDDLNEVVVTANRRSESVSDIPYNISAVSAADITNSGVKDLQGLTHMIPGLVSPDLGPRAGSINDTFIIRGLNASTPGIAANAAAPLVSTYVDETPLFANLKMTDIARVEVLRGPQSTLYGSGSMGGTVRIIHNKPDLDSVEFEATARGSHTANADNPSEGVDFVANLPISSTMAVRGSAGYEKLTGFSNATRLAEFGANAQPVLADPADPLTSGLVLTDRRDIDWSETWYARGQLMWKPNTATEFDLTYQHQTDHSGGYSQVLPGERYSQQIYTPQPGDFKTDLASLDVSYDAGFATLTSSTSFTSQTSNGDFDVTGLIEELAQFYGNYPRITSPINAQSGDESVTEEVRLVSKSGGPVDWTVGAYYSHRAQHRTDVELLPGFATWSELPGSGASAGYNTWGDVIQYYNEGVRPSANYIPDLNYTLDRHARFSDMAIFNETSWHVTDKWQVTGGIRQFWDQYSQHLRQTLPMCGALCSQSGADPTGLVDGTQTTSASDHVFKANTSYEIAEHTLLYYTWSQGFRRGGANALPTGNCYYCEPTSLLGYKPDRAINNEIGIKGEFGHGSSYTFTLYHIDWKDPQIEASTATGGFDFVTNGDRARTQGIETEVNLRITDGLKLQFGYSLTDAKLTGSFTRGYNDLTGYSGDRLPGVSRQQGTAAVDYGVPLSEVLDFHARLDASYRTDFWTGLPHSNGATDLPGFALVNLRAGIGLNKAWRFDAFVNNLTNSLAATSISAVLGGDHNRVEYVGRPRTIGLEVHYGYKGT